MTLYVPRVGIALGLSKAIQHGLTTVANPREGLAAHLLSGHRKQLLLHWRGAIGCDQFDEQWDPSRGDGLIHFDGEPDGSSMRLPLPPNVDIKPLNIRMGVPLWVIGQRGNTSVALAFGLYHPLFTSAQLDFYNPDNHRFLSRMYFIDPAESGGVASRETIARLMSEQTDELRLRGAHLHVDAEGFAPKLR